MGQERGKDMQVVGSVGGNRNVATIGAAATGGAGARVPEWVVTPGGGSLDRAGMSVRMGEAGSDQGTKPRGGGGVQRRVDLGRAPAKVNPTPRNQVGSKGCRVLL